jgi:microcin C transport system permease protein
MRPVNERRLAQFRANKRGMVSLIVFGLMFFLSLFAEFLANDKPILIRYDGAFIADLCDYPRRLSAATCRKRRLRRQRNQHCRGAKGFMLWPLSPTATTPAPARATTSLALLRRR